MAYDIDQGLHHIQLREQRTKKDYAEYMYWLTTPYYDRVDKIKLVKDNLNSQQYGAFYEQYPPAIAHAMKNKVGVVCPSL